MAVYVYNGTNSNYTANISATGRFSGTNNSTDLTFRTESTKPGMDHKDDFGTSHTVPGGFNHGVFGPITIASGVTVTVSTGATFTVV